MWVGGPGRGPVASHPFPNSWSLLLTHGALQTDISTLIDTFLTPQRLANRDFELEGHLVPKGLMVNISLASVIKNDERCDGGEAIPLKRQCSCPFNVHHNSILQFPPF